MLGIIHKPLWCLRAMTLNLLDWKTSDSFLKRYRHILHTLATKISICSSLKWGRNSNVLLLFLFSPTQLFASLHSWHCGLRNIALAICMCLENTSSKRKSAVRILLLTPTEKMSPLSVPGKDNKLRTGDWGSLWSPSVTGELYQIRLLFWIKG